MGYNSNFTGERVETLLKRQFIVNTLPAVPDEGTLSWTDGGTVTNYRIGEMVRVADENSETGYTFYQLNDITEGGMAVWSNLAAGTVDVSEKVRIALSSNQPQPDTSLNGATVTVTDTGTGLSLFSAEWQGQEIAVSIPPLTEYTIEVSSVEGYSTPQPQSYSSKIQGSRLVTMQYLSELVTVTLGSDNAVSVTGQVVSINGTEYTYQGVPVSAKIPFDTQYTVSVNAKYQYITPQPQIVTASQAQRSISMVYVYNPIKYSYVTLNQTFTDSATMLSGDINGDAVQLIKQNTHRVLAKKTADGEVTYCRLKDDDGAKYHDGTNAVLNGNEGDVFTKPPQFFWKVTSESTDIFKIGLAYGGNPGEGWHEWDGNVLIGTYEAYNSSSKLYSRSGVTPTVNVSQANFKAYARNRGTGYRIVDWEMHCVMAMLYYCQYGHMNCQLKIGAGTSSYPKVTGGTNALGMTDTVAGGNGDSGSINFFGLENWWGDLYEWVDNVVVDARVWKVTESDGTVRNAGTGYSSSGYASKMIIGDNFDLICKEINGSDTTGYDDYYYQSSSTSRVVQRSHSGSAAAGGVSYANAYYDSSYTSSYIGSRLAFRGVCVEAESVEAFKALPVM